jgi:toxin-antitoxin system PIN domain toxin
MILVDANILIYAYDEASPQHAMARDWLDKQLNGNVGVGLPWLNLLAFLRIVTNPRAMKKPESMQNAWRQVVGWLDCEPVWTPQPTERHVEIFGELLTRSTVYGNLTSDAYVAALAIEHGLTLCTADGDFSRFSGLRWINPLAAANTR